MGKEVAKFEKNFAKKFNSKFAVMVNSGSSANLLMITLLKYYDKIIKKNTKTKYNCTCYWMEHFLFSNSSNGL